MPAALDALPRPFGPYTLLERLGQGGMAEILLARQEAIEGVERLVAIKRVHPSLTSDPGFVEMFRDEVRIVSRLSHPNIGHILDAGEVEGQWYLAMEYVQGRDLARVIAAAERSGSLVPVALAVEIGRQLCAALDHAHRRTDAAGHPLRVVHRDITPDNVILTFDGTVKLVDFGIAMAETRVARTQPGMLKGKPPYMAPEQILGQPVDGRADLFSLGVLLYRMLTGVHPFYASSPDQTFRRVMYETPPPAAEVVADLSPSLSALVVQAMEKDPARRIGSARLFHDALDRLVVSLGVLMTPRRIAEWLLARFPEAAAARETLRNDPTDHVAAATASYLAADLSDLEDDLPTRPELPDYDNLRTRAISTPDPDAPATVIADLPEPPRTVLVDGAVAAEPIGDDEDTDDTDEPATVVAEPPESRPATVVVEGFDEAGSGLRTRPTRRPADLREVAPAEVTRTEPDARATAWLRDAGHLIVETLGRGGRRAGEGLHRFGLAADRILARGVARLPPSLRTPWAVAVAAGMVAGTLALIVLHLMGAL